MARTARSTDIAQPPVGVPCTLAPNPTDEIVMLLRIVERLPELSAPTDLPPERARRLLQTIHANHLHLAERASALLIAHPEHACRNASPCDSKFSHNRKRTRT